ncbi:MAG: UTP--glucose-1-phosphate uridylyltransferase [Planctomycetota bacterium]|nr:UTP--glucose-1-phosphate uridylyltransferase [Planctomycetota bacterium]
MRSAIQADLLRRRFADAGQEHVFAGERSLDVAGRERLYAALATIDLGLVAEFQRLTRGPAAAGVAPSRFEPAEVFPLRRGPSELAEERRARQRGAEMLRAGTVGWLLVAGGQASRLGHDAPKGCFPVTPLTGTSLYELFAQKLHAARARHGALGPWYVMTSEATDVPTREYFERERYFGLDPRDVVFFRQSMVPALDTAGRILMAAPDAPFLAPNGHGGLLAALATSGALEHARDRGVETFSYFQVDNPLAWPSDPLFLGLHALRGARMSSKVVKKRDAAEKVGVLGRVDGRLTCIEYSDLPATLREARDERGELVFWAGNIALHVLDRAFVEDLTRGGLQLPWHVARKRIPTTAADGVRTEVEGYKFETFVFDALSLAGPSVVLEVAREREFSPVKNKDGEDSASTARRDQCRLFASWAARAGIALPPPDVEGLHRIEVDPRFAEDEAEFLARASAKPREVAGGHLYAP